ncbi:MAG: hypothetical protein A3F41_06905 [Coxiella sp. RIFCSPHIGHO2_12_FULL_44_14]|nr:MAG: hypothetical protein A3F41_06905 [Coxiella sp. RIFCSPHIGHO2_12_FULL_44_14]
MRENSTFRTVTNEEIISLSSKIGDAFALLLIAFSEVAFGLLAGDNTIDSVNTPIKKYFPSTPNWVFALNNDSAITLGLTDSTLTVFTITNTRKQRLELIDQFREGVRELLARWGKRELHVLSNLPSLANLLKYKGAYLLYPDVSSSSDAGRLYYVTYTDCLKVKEVTQKIDGMKKLFGAITEKIPSVIEIPTFNTNALLQHPHVQLITGKRYLTDSLIRNTLIPAHHNSAPGFMHLIDPKDNDKKPLSSELNFPTSFLPLQQTSFQRKLSFSMLFMLNLLVFSITFLVGSAAPWAGVAALQKKFGNDTPLSQWLVHLAGLASFFGQMLAYLYSCAKFIFGNPVLIEEFFLSSWKHKKDMLQKLFTTKQGGRVLASTLINATLRGMTFVGLTRLEITYILSWILKQEDSNLEASSGSLIFAYMVGIAAFLQTAASQGRRDWDKNIANAPFEIHAETQPLLQPQPNFSPGRYIKISEEVFRRLPDERELPELTRGGKAFKYLLQSILVGLVGGTFLSRVFSAPSLATGEKTPEEFGTPQLLISIGTLILGVLAYWQYCTFMYHLGKETNTSWLEMSQCLWERSTNDINNNNNHKTPTGDSPQLGTKKYSAEAETQESFNSSRMDGEADDVSANGGTSTGEITIEENIFRGPSQPAFVV